MRLSKTKPDPTKLRPAAFIPATGLVDTTRQTIEKALDLYTPLAPDVYLTMMRMHAVDAGNALEDAKDCIVSKNDDFAMRYQAASQMQQVALSYIAPNDRPNFFARLQTEVRDKVIAEAGDEPAQLAAACVTKLKNFHDAHKAALDDFQGPRLMSVEGRALTVQDLERQAQLERELPNDPSTAAPSMLLARYMRHLARGEDQKLIELEVAAQKYCIACRAENPTELTSRLRSICGKAFDADKEKVAAFDLLSAIRGRKARSIPQSLKVTERVFYELRGVFQIVVGVHATLMSPSERAARFGYDGHGADKNIVGEMNPFEVDPSWLRRRFEQKEPFKLPGYSKPTSKDSDGNWVRDPLPMSSPDRTYQGR